MANVIDKCVYSDCFPTGHSISLPPLRPPYFLWHKNTESIPSQ